MTRCIRTCFRNFSSLHWDSLCRNFLNSPFVMISSSQIIHYISYPIHPPSCSFRFSFFIVKDKLQQSQNLCSSRILSRSQTSKMTFSSNAPSRSIFAATISTGLSSTFGCAIILASCRRLKMVCHATLFASSSAVSFPLEVQPFQDFTPTHLTTRFDALPAVSSIDHVNEALNFSKMHGPIISEVPFPASVIETHLNTNTFLNYTSSYLT